MTIGAENTEILGSAVVCISVYMVDLQWTLVRCWVDLVPATNGAFFSRLFNQVISNWSSQTTID